VCVIFVHDLFFFLVTNVSLSYLLFCVCWDCAQSRLEWDGAYALSDLEARFEEAKAKPKKDYSLLKTLKQVCLILVLQFATEQ